MMVEVSDEVGSLGEESNARRRVGRVERREKECLEWNQYVEAQVCASLVPHACFGARGGQTREFPREGGG